MARSKTAPTALLEGAPAPIRPSKLFIGGVTRHTTTKQLRDHFSRYGRVLDCVAMRQPDGRPRGFGYVTLDSPSAADRCLAEPQVIDGRVVDIKRAVPEGLGALPFDEPAARAAPPTFGPPLCGGPAWPRAAPRQLGRAACVEGSFLDLAVATALAGLADPQQRFPGALWPAWGPAATAMAAATQGLLPGGAEALDCLDLIRRSSRAPRAESAAPAPAPAPAPPAFPEPPGRRHPAAAAAASAAGLGRCSALEELAAALPFQSCTPSTATPTSSAGGASLSADAPEFVPTGAGAAPPAGGLQIHVDLLDDQVDAERSLRQAPPERAHAVLGEITNQVSRARAAAQKAAGQDQQAAAWKDPLKPGLITHSAALAAAKAPLPAMLVVHDENLHENVDPGSPSNCSQSLPRGAGFLKASQSAFAGAPIGSGLRPSGTALPAAAVCARAPGLQAPAWVAPPGLAPPPPPAGQLLPTRLVLEEALAGRLSSPVASPILVWPSAPSPVAESHSVGTQTSCEDCGDSDVAEVVHRFGATQADRRAVLEQRVWSREDMLVLREPGLQGRHGRRGAQQQPRIEMLR